MVVIPVVSTRTHVLCALEPPLGEGTDRRTLRKNQVLVSRALLDWEIKASQDITAGKLHRFITPMSPPCVLSRCHGTCSGHMLWEVFGIYVVGRVWGLYCGRCCGFVFWIVFQANVLGRVRGNCSGKGSGSLLWDVFRSYVEGRVQGLCCGTC